MGNTLLNWNRQRDLRPGAGRPDVLDIVKHSADLEAVGDAVEERRGDLAGEASSAHTEPGNGINGVTGRRAQDHLIFERSYNEDDVELRMGLENVSHELDRYCSLCWGARLRNT